MSTANIKNEPARRKYLATLQALSAEMTTAISAIERNDLAGLQNSISAQETICRELAAGWQPSDGAAVWPEIRDASHRLAKVNRTYSGLLKRAQRSASLLAALYRNYGSGYGQGLAALEPTHTWSCEG